MIVISRNLVIRAPDATPDPDLPLICWHNLVYPGGIMSDTADANFPASNLANNATHLEWRAADTSEQYVTFTPSDTSQELNYLAVARHNFGSAEVPVSVEGFVDGEWIQIVEEVMLPDDAPVIFRYTDQPLDQVRLRLQSGSAPPRAAVVYMGRALLVERKIYVGHTPMPHGRRSNVSNGRSESGNFLGRIVLGSWVETTVPLSLISPAWYREKMDPFLAVAKDTPFFFSWRPQSYPREVGYGWLTDDPAPAPAGPANLLAFQLKVGGIA